jgi:uncharacterized SAM-binding protein YcdF (DUF218 family)
MRTDTGNPRRVDPLTTDLSKKDLSGKKWFRVVAVLLAALTLVCALMFAANAGRLLVVDAPQPSDVILVLAGETDRRPARALQLLDQGYGRRVVIDVPAGETIYGSSELQLAEKYFQDLPQATSIHVCPIKGLSTREESHDAEKCLAGEPGNRILIVTSEFHTRRALNIFRHEVRGKSFSVAASRDESQFGTRWWTNRQWAKTCLDEWLKFLWWTVVER